MQTRTRRRRRQIMASSSEEIVEEEEVNAICSKCHHPGASIVCDNEGCPMVFHLNCSETRLGRLRPRAYDEWCYECIVGRLHETDRWMEFSHQDDLERTWLDIDNEDSKYNCPQLGDSYYFIPEAYERFILSSYRVLNFGPTDVIWPMDVIHGMKNTRSGYACKVI